MLLKWSTDFNNHNINCINVQVSKLVSLGHKHWLPYTQRLTGWRKQVRTRNCGIRDKVNFSPSLIWNLYQYNFLIYNVIIVCIYIWMAIHVQVYYHGSKRFRTFMAVKRYIYLGYPPSKENADEPLVRIVIICCIYIYIYIIDTRREYMPSNFIHALTFIYMNYIFAGKVGAGTTGSPGEKNLI